ncbi:MAG: type II secretion system protein, partial [Opitutaceae bacterium]|nr:type II secretion system protein [Verrucomicrobiales bacterium]
MKTFTPQVSESFFNRAAACRALAGFTMIEIAISLAIIGFALVAIVGVLPAGLNVQKENREETILNQDGPFLLEAIRSGAQGFDDLTNYVQSITVMTLPSGVSNNYFFNDLTYGFTNGARIIALLSIPKYFGVPTVTNLVTAK